MGLGPLRKDIAFCLNVQKKKKEKEWGVVRPMALSSLVGRRALSSACPF